MKMINFWKKAYILPAFLIISLSTAACGHYTEFDDSNFSVLQEKIFNTTPGKTFNLKAYSGDVIVTTSDEPQVYVKILGNDRAEKKVRFEFSEGDDGVSIITKGHENWNFFNFGNGIRLRFEVRLPKNYNAKISSSGGDIKLENLNGNIDFSTSGGDVFIKNSTGEIEASTSGGEVNLADTKGNLELKTSGGDIRSDGFDGNIYAHTSGGSVSLKGGNGKIDAGTSGGNVDLDYSGANMGIYLETSGGNITLKLPQDFNANAKMSTSGGSIHCDFPGNNVTTISSGKYEAEFNKGGSDVIAKTSGGDISVTKK